MMTCAGCGNEISGTYIEVERLVTYCFNPYEQDVSCAVILIDLGKEQVLEIEPALQRADFQPSSLGGSPLVEGT